jgi:hypothetical protein
MYVRHAAMQDLIFLLSRTTMYVANKYRILRNRRRCTFCHQQYVCTCIFDPAFMKKIFSNIFKHMTETPKIAWGPFVVVEKALSLHFDGKTQDSSFRNVANYI